MCRAECKRWMGGPEPEMVGNAYISECHKYSNGTIRYRADVCCQGKSWGRHKAAFIC